MAYNYISRKTFLKKNDEEIEADNDDVAENNYENEIIYKSNSYCNKNKSRKNYLHDKSDEEIKKKIKNEDFNLNNLNHAAEINEVFSHFDKRSIETDSCEDEVEGEIDYNAFEDGVEGEIDSDAFEDDTYSNGATEW